MRLLPTLVISFAALLPAQSTYIVDRNNGSGTDFTTILAALPRVADGDRLLVRAGRYQLPIYPGIRKAITIQGLGAVELGVNNSFFAFPVHIREIGKGKVMAFRDVQFKPTGILVTGDIGALASVENCAGTVVFDRVSFGTTNGTIASIRAIDSSLTLIRNTTSDMGVVGVRAKVVAEGCNFSGRPGNSIVSGRPAFSIENGELSLAATNGSGGDGVVWNGVKAPGPAIEAKRSVVHVRGVGSSFRAGRNHGAAPAIRGDASSTLLHETKTTLTATNATTPAVSGFKQRTIRSLPLFLSKGDPRLGSAWNVVLTGAPSDPYVAMFSLPGPGIRIPGTESFWLDPSLLVPVGHGVLDTSGTRALKLPVTNDAKWTTYNFLLQAATRADLTNPLALGMR